VIGVNTVLSPATAQVAGGNGGHGGFAQAIAGNGGAGNPILIHGGDGGNITANGGDGGFSFLRNFLNGRVGNGGNGGAAHFGGGIGEDGWTSLCALPEGLVGGGNGGLGGVASGSDGEGGEGLVNGNHGNVFVDARTGNSGRGGQGEPPGVSGNVNDQITKHGVRNNSPPLGFTKFVPFPCLGVQKSIQILLNNPPQNCTSPDQAQILGITSFSLTPINVTLSVQNPGHDLQFLDVTTFQLFAGGTYFTSPNPANPQIRVTRQCGFPDVASPVFYCIDVNATVGSTMKTFRVPYRIRAAGVPLNEAADLVACGGAP
jgi:hypothetical protein